MFLIFGAQNMEQRSPGTGIVPQEHVATLGQIRSEGLHSNGRYLGRVRWEAKYEEAMGLCGTRYTWWLIPLTQ